MVDSDGSDVARTLSAKVSARLPTALLRSDCIAAAGLAASVLLAAAAVLSALPTEKGGSRAVTVAIGSIGYHVLPEFVADLRTSRSRSHYLQLAAVLEVPEEALARLQAEETRILSDVQTRLRELQREDLAGAAGLERVRRDIAEVVDRHIAPSRARDVLFTKFLVD
ncbi:MAG: flagellar basal body-associated protein FliL [Bacteroidota bacterium]